MVRSCLIVYSESTFCRCSLESHHILRLIFRCIKGDNDSCRCEDPLDPQPRAEFRAWSKAQSTNRELVTELVDAGSESPDIAFLGGSVIEEMNGKWFGQTKDDGLKGLQTLFQKNFQKDSGADLDAVALGIAGDTVSGESQGLPIVFFILWPVPNDSSYHRVLPSYGD